MLNLKIKIKWLWPILNHCPQSTYWNVTASNSVDRYGHLLPLSNTLDRLCGLVVRVLGYRYRGPGSIPGATRFSEK
jgi:hypothetical protein